MLPTTPPDAGTPARVCVLLATFNGEAWLPEQLASLRAQAGVALRVVASDDQSGDATRALLEAAAAQGGLVVLPDVPERFGNANRNFLRLIRDTPLGDAEYFALSDQDDIWLPHKLRRAVDVMRADGADAYGANCTAFWPDGRRKLLVKSQPQRPFDHLFESAGPGCSFVFSRAMFADLQRWVVARWAPLQDIKVHDWLIYAWGRGHGWRWVIDDASVLLYRQHERNEAGANAGIAGAVPRLLNIAQGRFRHDAIAIGDAAGLHAPALDRLRRFSLADRLWLALHARQLRRAFVDVIALAFLMLVMPRRTT